MAVISYRHEVLRKLIHLSSLWMPLAIYYLNHVDAIIVFTILMLGMLVYETTRRRQHKLGLFIHKLFQPILRSFESDSRFTGATHMIFSALICVILFPRDITVTALSILMLADTAASLIGRRWGRTKILDKSFEGCAAFFVTACLVVLILNPAFPVSPHYLLAGLVAALVATIVEAMASVLRLDDNLGVTLSVGVVMWLIQAVM